MTTTKQQLELLRLAAVEASTITVDVANDLVFVFDVTGNIVGTAAANQVGGGAGGTPGGSDTHVQYNDGGAFAGEADFAWDKTNDRLRLENIRIFGTFENYNDALADIGPVENSDIRGYGVDFVTDKSLNFCKVGPDSVEEEGGLRITNGDFQIYTGGAWADIVANFRLREDETGTYEFEHKPIGFEYWIEVATGNSSILASNGLPFIQQYGASVGPLPIPLQVDGGSF